VKLLIWELFTLLGFRSISVDAEVEKKGDELDAAVPVNMSVRFTFTMESLIVDLFTGGSKEVCFLMLIFFHF